MTITQYEDKKKEEQEFLEKFLLTGVGKNWFEENLITSIEESEAPDFICDTKSGSKIGIEITNFFVQHKNRSYSQALTRIGNKVCKLAEEKYQIKLSILISQYDKRALSPKWSEMLDYAYNPGFEIVPKETDIKPQIEQLLSDNISKLKQGLLVQKWIEIGNEYYQITIDSYPSISSHKYDCHVNNTGIVKFNPFYELQKNIEKKNNKIAKYENKVEHCFLLVIIPTSRLGNYCEFTNEIFEYYFSSKFDAIYLYDEDKNQAWQISN